MLTVTCARRGGQRQHGFTLTVTYSPDITAPVVIDHRPDQFVNGSRRSRPARMAISAGTASDAVGVTQVTWANDRGGSGTATGTDLVVG